VIRHVIALRIRLHSLTEHCADGPTCSSSGVLERNWPGSRLAIKIPSTVSDRGASKDKRTDTSAFQLVLAKLVADQIRDKALECERDRLRADLGKTQDRLDEAKAQLAQTTVQQGRTLWWQKLIGKG